MLPKTSRKRYSEREGSFVPICFKDTLTKATNSGVDIFKAYKDLNPPDGEQAKAFNFFKAMRDSRQLVAIDTPWGFFNNLEIKGLTALQGADSESVTDFSLTLKEFRTTNTLFVDFEFDDKQGRNAIQSASQEDQGRAQGKPEPLTSSL